MIPRAGQPAHSTTLTQYIMKQLFLTKQDFLNVVEPETAYEIAEVDVNSLDCGACKVADQILSSAMGTILGARDPYTNEVIAGWWEDGCEYEGWATLHDGTRCLVKYTAGAGGEKLIEELESSRELDEDDTELIEMF